MQNECCPFSMLESWLHCPNNINRKDLLGKIDLK